MRGRAGLVAAVVGVPVFVVLALWIASLLLESCTLGPLSRWLDACPPVAAGVSGDLAAEMEHTGRLEDRVRQLERQLALLRDCPPAPPETPPEEEPEPVSADEPAPPQEEPLPDDTPAVPEEEQPPPPEENLPGEDDESPEFDERVEEQEGEVSEELTVTLIWNDRSDLDLEVHCPGGGAVGVNAQGCDGGLLDVDANGYGTGGLRMMARPVENIRFRGEAAEGEYWVRIHIAEGYEAAGGNDRRRNLGRHPFSVRVISRGEVTVFEGVHEGLGRGDVWLSFTHE